MTAAKTTEIALIEAMSMAGFWPGIVEFPYEYGRGAVAAGATVLASILPMNRRATAAGMTAFMIRLTRPGMMTGRQMRTCWQALYQACPPPSSAQEKRARGRS